MTSELGLADPWRHKYPKEGDFSFYANVHDNYSKIDFFFHTESLTLSDDAPNVLSFDLGKGHFFKYWRLNVCLLNNIMIVENF